MASVTSPIRLKGAVGDLVFSGTPGGGQRAYLKAHASKKKWHRTRRHTVSGKHAMAFGGAAMCGSAIYKAICLGDRQNFAPYSHNRIARRLRRHADPDQRYCEHYHFGAAAGALAGLDLGRGRDTGRAVTVLPVGPHHAPTHLRIRGLREGADAIARLGSARLECRVAVRHAAFPEVAFDHGGFTWSQRVEAGDFAHRRTTTLWIPVDLIPADGLGIALTRPADAPAEPHPVLHFVVVEWRTVQQGKRPKVLPQHAVVKFAAATVPADLLPGLGAALPAPTRPGRRYRHPRKAAQGLPAHNGGDRATPPPRRPPFREACPRLYLKMALMGDRPPA